MMNGKTLSVIRKWKDTDGNYLWQPGLLAGQPPRSLLWHRGERGHAGCRANATGFVRQLCPRLLDFRSYRHSQPARSVHQQAYVHFYTTKRVGGMLVIPRL